ASLFKIFRYAGMSSFVSELPGEFISSVKSASTKIFAASYFSMNATILLGPSTGPISMGMYY
ncbi:MAG TPA: hypothetical protein VGL10_08740, partial [Gammaproteobacteria bacterium]